MIIVRLLVSPVVIVVLTLLFMIYLLAGVLTWVVNGEAQRITLKIGDRR